MSVYINPDDLEGIAVIGMAGRFPGADDIPTLWDNICNGIESITYFTGNALDPDIPSSLIVDPNYIKARGIINNSDAFDADFFNCSPRSAQIMDPQNRIFMEVVWEALENACCVPDSPGVKTGLFAGKGFNTYYDKYVCSSNDIIENFGAFEARLLNEKDFFATLASYKLNLTGPSVNINTGCSTSLVAVCQAFDSLLGYQCDVALAGGATIYCPQNTGYLYEKGKIASADGHCRPFDGNAAGTVFGSGAGVIVMKRLAEALEDGNRIYAVIKGCGLNNDGSSKMSFTAPSVDGQADAVTMALATADVDADMISYIETHGTGTPLGDPVEIEALNQAFSTRTAKKHFCAIGSIKANIGHTDAAAGIAGIIKTALCIYHGKIPPSINYKTPNPKIDFDNSPFFVNTKLRDWPTHEHPRTAGVSALGVGGTNAHVILGEAPEINFPAPPVRPCRLIMLSSKSKAALEARTRQLAEHLKTTPGRDIDDVAFSLQVGRQEMDHRRFLVCNDMTEAVKKLHAMDARHVFTGKTETTAPPVVFMFPGQGSQYVNMGLNFYAHVPEFRDTVDQCCNILMPYLGCDLRSIIYPEDDVRTAEQLLKETRFQQPAMFTIEYALSRLWTAWGITPSAMIGHSIGEYVAACLAGIFSLPDALMLVAHRGRMMQELAGGSMLSVRLPAARVKKRLNGELSLAAVNAPSLCVVSGPAEAVTALKNELDTEDIISRPLHTSHAFHSSMMEGIIEPFTQIVASTKPSAPEIPVISSVTGTWITPEQAADPAYWGAQLRATVRFSQGIETLWENRERVLLEVGPRTATTIFARQHVKDMATQKVISTLENTAEQNTEWESILHALGHLWIRGVKIAWHNFYKHEKRKRLPLPTYPFEKKRYWLKKVNRPSPVPPPVRPQQDHMNKDDSGPMDTLPSEKETTDAVQIHTDRVTYTETELLLTDIWHSVLGVDRETAFNNYYSDLGGDSLSSLKIIALINKKTGVSLDPFFIMLNKINQIALHIEERFSDSKANSENSRQTNDTFNLEPYFFGDSEKRLCGIYHRPSAQKDRKEGILICHPLPQEYMHCYWSLRELSDLLADSGFHVLRFDYYGTGDSAGESIESSIAQWKQDIMSAAGELTSKSNIEQISVIGLRFGAALAFQSFAENRIPCNKFLLWDPVLDGKTHINELELIQDEIMMIQKPGLKKDEIFYDNEQLIGYPFSSRHCDSIKRVRLFADPIPEANKIFIVASKDRIDHDQFNSHISSKHDFSRHYVVNDVSSWGKLSSVMNAQFPSKILNKLVSILRE